MFKKSFILGFFTACLIFVVIHTTGAALELAEHKIPEAKKMKIIEQLVDKNYVEDIDRDDLEEYMYAGYVAGLGDRYSTYMTKEQFSAFSEGLDGFYSGIGIKIFMNEDGQMEINDVYTDSPAAAAGLKTGDIIYKIGDIEIKDRDSYGEAVGFIKNTKKTTRFYIKRNSTELLEADITPESITVPSVSYCMADNNTGYIRIAEFEANTATAFKEAIAALDGMDSLVIDLRNNPGGLLNVVNDIADTLLPEGTITYIEHKNGEKKYYKSDENCLNIPIAVLVNSNSASASEVLTGAIKDFGAGKIVGTTTFGKGVVQDTYRLKDGSAVKLTTAKYYTPKGVCIQGTGIAPDYEIFAPEGFTLPSLKDSKALIDPSTDIQLAKALEILK